MKQPTQQPYHFSRLLALLFFWVIGISVAQATAVPQLSIKSAAYNKKTASLVVKTSVKHTSGLVSLIHSKGGVLGQTSDSEHTFSIPMAQVGDIPCQVEARLGEMKISKAVSGASAECGKVPTCKILPFAKNTRPLFNTPFTFEAQVALKDKKAAPLTVEWDFAGGVMGHPYERLLKDGKAVLSGKVKTEATFVRDNSRYHVRFAAHDNLGRRCEAGMYVDIGIPPTGLPDIAPLAQAAQASQPPLASGLKGDMVVLPFEKRSMQCGHEAELMPAEHSEVAPPNYNSIDAYVYEKGLRPVLLGEDRVQMTYAAASNAADPVGANSINSTSQSWPLGVPNVNASLKKGELMEHYQPPAGAILADNFFSISLIEAMGFYTPGWGQREPVADEGAYYIGQNSTLASVNLDHGRYMPGKDDPYGVNQPQAFSEFSSSNNWFSAYWLPLTDIDDSGRVNPATLMRVQAIDKDSQTALATTDVTVTAGKDFHCRECHALGKIAANPKIKRKNKIDGSDLMLMPTASDSIEDQEKAALQNMASLHWFNDMPDMAMGNMQQGSDQPIQGNAPNVGCVAGGMCHGGSPIPFAPDQNQIPSNYTGQSASVIMHQLHGALQYNSDKSDILRDEKGRYLCPTTGNKSACLDPSKSLFPVKDANGKILPMEENCLKCHSGQREQCYRDRMYTAGVTCYQCHGDMLAMGQMYPKSNIHSDGNTQRMPLLDQPDCGSCHTGSGNVGKDASKGYFSAGVKTLAFAEDDPSATPNAVDLTNPDQRRFAVPQTEINPLALKDGRFNSNYNTVLSTPLYRLGKDAHGQVACAACHGPAHGIWPNRDPNANDNVTSLELQGHTGSLLECNACHKPDSFAKFEDNDDGLKVIDAKVNVLGGPHSLHPINDPYWWKAAGGDSPNVDGSSSGGWHNNYAKLPGKAGEDQCAACHGNDHKGTRLSKTPVDRVFDFSDAADLKQLKKAGIKPKVAVKAGTPIGCDTCHTVALSCQNSPNASCGQTSAQTTGSSNQAPSLSPGVINAVIGQDLNAQLTISDPENDAVTIELIGNPQDVAIDASGLLTVTAGNIQSWASSQGSAAASNQPLPRPPFNHAIKVGLHDARGAFAFQTFTVRLDCPVGLYWDQNSVSCLPLVIYSYQPSGGLDAGADWTYQVLAQSGSPSTLTYSLMVPVVPGMTIDKQGKITWKTSQVPSSGSVATTVKVADNAGNEAALSFNLTLCRAPMHFDATADSCVGSVHITSTPPLGSSAYQFSYQVTATDDNHQAISYSLIDAPVGFSITPQGLISGDPSLTTLGHQGQLSFTVQASTAADNWARQAISSQVCGADMPVGEIHPSGYHNQDPTFACANGPITFTSTPELMVSAERVYSYQTAVSNSNGLPVEFSLLGALPGMSIDNNGLVSWNSSGYTGQNLSYLIVAKDAQGSWVGQPVSLGICPAEAPIYNANKRRCVPPIVFTSSSFSGADADQVYHFQVTTSNANNLPVNLSLSDAPLGMSIDGNGLISWLAASQPDPSSYFSFSIIATDSSGASTTQSARLMLCLPPTNWDIMMHSCRGPVQITSTQPVQGLNVGETFGYQVTAIDKDVNGGGIKYSLTDSTLASIAIDADSGLINWVAEDLYSLGGYAYFTINATDKLGQQDQQVVYIYTCTLPYRWSSIDGYCIS